MAQASSCRTCRRARAAGRACVHLARKMRPRRHNGPPKKAEHRRDSTRVGSVAQGVTLPRCARCVQATSRWSPPGDTHHPSKRGPSPDVAQHLRRAAAGAPYPLVTVGTCTPPTVRASNEAVGATWGAREPSRPYWTNDQNRNCGVSVRNRQTTSNLGHKKTLSDPGQRGFSLSG